MWWLDLWNLVSKTRVMPRQLLSVRPSNSELCHPGAAAVASSSRQHNSIDFRLAVAVIPSLPGAPLHITAHAAPPRAQPATMDLSVDSPVPGAGGEQQRDKDKSKSKEPRVGRACDVISAPCCRDDAGLRCGR